MSNITAVICEYNPFHKGHEYQLNKIKDMFPLTKIVCIMSPDFVQRGRPAVFDKYIRGKCAVACGADLAVSVPQVFALLSAEGFARAGVRCAVKLGASKLVFGIENGDTVAFEHIARTLLMPEFEFALKEQLVSSPSFSYPIIRQKVLEKFLDTETVQLAKSPNNILAIEYFKAIISQNLPIIPIAIPRNGSDYHSKETNGEFSSATAIRECIYNNENFLDFLPQATHSIIKNAPMIDVTKYNDFLYTALIVSAKETIDNATGNKELSDMIISSISDSSNYYEFRKALTGRKFTQTAIERVLTNILFKIKKDEYMFEHPKYVTLLAFNDSGRKVIKNSSIPTISKFSNYRSLDTRQAEAELFADRIWSRCLINPENDKYFVNKIPYMKEDKQ